MRIALLCALLLLSRGARAQQNAAPDDRTPQAIQPQNGGFLGFLTHPYMAHKVTAFDDRNSPRIYQLLKAGNPYLSLADTIALAIENNLDVEISRYQIPAAASDLERAKGGAGLRGVSFVSSEVPAGVGGPTSPLLNIAATSTTPSTVVPAEITDLSALQSGATSTSILPAGAGSPGPFAAGPAVPVFDPTLTGALTYTHTTSPDVNIAQSGVSATTTTGVSSSLALQQGFFTGGTYALAFNAQSQNVNSPFNAYNPYTTGSLGLTVTQPLLRGFGPALSRRYITIAKNDQKISDLNFRQQLINTVYGISRLYYDLLALADDLRVKEDTLRAASTLFENTRASVEEGVMAPVERTRAEAEVAGAEQDVVNARGLFEEQEVILKNLISRTGTADPLIRSAHLVPTESLTVPLDEPVPQLEDLLSQASRSRPDLLQTGYEIANSQIQLKATRNELLPELDLVGVAANNGLTGQPNSQLSSSAQMQSSGLTSGFIGGYTNLLEQLFARRYPTYSIGVQLNLPIRNRVAQGDLVRDELGLREVHARKQQLINQSRLEVEDALVGLQRSRAAYVAAVRTRTLQEKSLQIERVRYEAGVDTAFFVIQYQSYLAQAQSTEVAAKANYFKAKAALDRATGITLDSNNISVDQAFHGRIAAKPATLPAK